MNGWKKRCENATTLDEAVAFSSGQKIEDLLSPEPMPYIKGLVDAADFFRCNYGRKMTIVGDYDVDGVMSSVILYHGILQYTGLEADVIIPRRFSDGYGLRDSIVESINGGMLITVDNGITAVGPIESARRKRMKTIVIDHHLGGETLPSADVIVDPAAVPGSAFTYYSGAGLAYRFVKELIPDDRQLLGKLMSLAAVATIADVVPLWGANRYLVRGGLSNLSKGISTSGMLALVKQAGFDEITVETVAFYLGPMLNAPGRLYDDGARKSFNLIARDNPFANDTEAERAAASVIADNELRKQKADAAEKRAMEVLKVPEALVIVHYDPDCEEGIIGILAGRLAETFGRPAIVLTDSREKGIYKGSGRSVKGVNLKELLDCSAECLVTYGGHALAAGLTVRAENVGTLTESLSASLRSAGFTPIEADKAYDLEIMPDEVPAVVDHLKRLAPFGEGVPEPVFLVKGIQSLKTGFVGRDKQHVSIRGGTVSAIGFDMADQFVSLGEPDEVNAVGYLGENKFNGKVTPQLRMLDIGAAEKKEVKKASLQDFLNS